MKYLYGLQIVILLIIGGGQDTSAQITEIPFEMQSDRMLIKVQFNKGDSLLFIFDTGATSSLIDSLTAERAGIQKKDNTSMNVVGSGGAQTYRMALNQRLHLAGNLQIDSIGLILMNLNSFKTSVKENISGIIGYDILSKYTTKIDFEKHKILLYDRISSIDTAGYKSIAFEFNKGLNIPRFPITIKLANNEMVSGRVMFDSGAELALLVSAPFSNFHNLRSKVGKTTTSYGRGINAATVDESAVIKEMSFMGFKFGRMAIELTRNDKAESRDGYLGIMGMHIIKRFNVILDYAHKKIFLKPNQNYNLPFNTTI